MHSVSRSPWAADQLAATVDSGEESLHIFLIHLPNYCSLKTGGPLACPRLAFYGCPHVLTQTPVLSFGIFFNLLYWESLLMSTYSQVKMFNSQAIMGRSFPHTVGWHSSASKCFCVCWCQTGAFWNQSGCFLLPHAQDPWKETPINRGFFLCCTCYVYLNHSCCFN